MSGYSWLAVPLGLALLTVVLRRVHGPKYWMVALGVTGLSGGLSIWLGRDNQSPISPTHQVTNVIFLFVIPLLLGFAIANVKALRARPWLVMIFVPLVFVASMFVDMIVGMSLDILQP